MNIVSRLRLCVAQKTETVQYSISQYKDTFTYTMQIKVSLYNSRS